MVYNINFGGEERQPDIRMLHDMKDVIYDNEWLSSHPDFELYYMFRQLALCNNDLLTMRTYHLRYDITIIPPAMLGCEFVKTAGHYHPNISGQSFSYPELYQVLEGEAIYLLQKQSGYNITDVVEIKAKKGDIVLIPPNYGHVTINASGQTLKMSNWVCCDFSSFYALYREKKGGTYYLLESGYRVNKNYHNVPEMRHVKPVDLPEFGLFYGKDMYHLVNDVEKLDFLRNPGNYADSFQRAING